MRLSLYNSLSPNGVWTLRWLRFNEWWCIRKGARAMQEQANHLDVGDLDGAAQALRFATWWSERLKEFRRMREALEKAAPCEEDRLMEESNTLEG